jgi:hypothetical protein
MENRFSGHETRIDLLRAFLVTTTGTQGKQLFCTPAGRRYFKTKMDAASLPLGG